ncbi:DUF2058 family protein [Leucothrix pacifica]|uniref:DUF2058 domain-containing protein n=1 Tax=Leucothrix pacifica TaxID=1247513 RepID=A0A317C2Y2_9GAMM|nr:DUF2058 family protein [Leucothrix pacifica]PWQ93046.1 DUF2058 domain-containing protein [Leucothrix pacifica]
MSSLRDQLLKAGLVTEEQVKKAETKPKPSGKPRKNNKNKSKPQTGQTQSAAKAKKRELTDLERFYKERDSTEKAEKEEQDRQRKEAARVRKQNRAKIGALIRNNMQNDEAAELRYNFVVGSSVKYLFVTEAQQELLSAGKLAIAFLGEKRCLIAPEVADQILEIEPSRIIIRFEPDSE